MTMEPKYAGGSETSKAAADSVKASAPTLRELVLRKIRTAGSTCDELEVLFEMSHQTISPRIYELRKLGLVCDSGTRRPTRSGRKAVVWSAV